jgi:hypothetical protein
MPASATNSDSAWAVGVRGVILAILWNMVFYGGGIVGAWLAVRAAGWAQARLLTAVRDR